MIHFSVCTPGLCSVCSSSAHEFDVLLLMFHFFLPQGSMSASCWGQLCFSSCCAARSMWRQTQTRGSWPSGRSGRSGMASPMMKLWDRRHVIITSADTECTCGLIHISFVVICFVLWCRTTSTGRSSGRRTRGWLKTIIKGFSWAWGHLLWPWINMETW